MATHRYGIHGMREEHFGMAPAEMARAGAIVWVPRGGGQTEIVGGEAHADVRLGRGSVRRLCRLWRARPNNNTGAITSPRRASDSPRPDRRRGQDHRETNSRADVRCCSCERFALSPWWRQRRRAWSFTRGGEHDVATLTAREWSAPETMRITARRFRRADRQAVVPAMWRWLAALPEHHVTRLRMCSVLRYARQLASHYDVLITADNYAVFPKPASSTSHPAQLQPDRRG